MTLRIDEILSNIESHAKKTGYFQRVNGHEPKNAPGNGVHCAIWLNTIEPVETSALNSVSVVVVFNIQLYLNFIAKPEDGIDPKLVKAVDAMMTEYAGDFEVGGEARNIDFFGSSGFKFEGRAGYLDIDSKKFRVVTIQLPIIINDAWAEVA